MQLTAHQGKSLSEFRGKLSAEECIYVLATLMQQYFLLISSKVEVFISDKLCKVNREGEVFVFGWADRETSTEPADNYVKAITIILELVSNLFCEKELLWTNENG
jgi:hypothetical protein